VFCDLHCPTSLRDFKGNVERTLLLLSVGGGWGVQSESLLQVEGGWGRLVRHTAFADVVHISEGKLERRKMS
jgi:hypothetical protein